MSKLLCVYCEKEAKYIWWNEEALYRIGSEQRPVLYPLCEDHGSNMYPRIKIRIEGEVVKNET